MHCKFINKDVQFDLKVKLVPLVYRTKIYMSEETSMTSQIIQLLFIHDFEANIKLVYQYGVKQKRQSKFAVKKPKLHRLKPKLQKLSQNRTTKKPQYVVLHLQNHNSRYCFQF